VVGFGEQSGIDDAVGEVEQQVDEDEESAQTDGEADGEVQVLVGDGF